MSKNEFDWDEYIEDLADRILDSLHYFCWEISGDDPLDCFSFHSERSPYDLASEFIGVDEYSSWKVRKEDLKLLEKMPREKYYELDKLLKSYLMPYIKKLKKEKREIERSERKARKRRR